MVKTAFLVGFDSFLAGMKGSDSALRLYLPSIDQRNDTVRLPTVVIHGDGDNKND